MHLLVHHQSAIAQAVLDLFLLLLRQFLAFYLVDVDLLTFLRLRTLAGMDDVREDQAGAIITERLAISGHEHVTLLLIPPGMHIL